MQTICGGGGGCGYVQGILYDPMNKIKWGSVNYVLFYFLRGEVNDKF